MRKLLIIFVFGICCQGTIAQARTSPGIRLGLNSASVSNTRLDSKAGLNAAIYANIRLGNHYALQPELGYSGQGGEARGRDGFDLRIHYMTLALANKVFPIPNNGFYLVFGPGLDFDFENNLVNLINETNDPEVTPFDLTVFGGLGYEFRSGLVLSVRYKQGLLNIDLFGNDLESDLQIREGNMLNAVWQFGIGYNFNF